MKLRILSTLLAALLLVSLVACTPEKEEPSKSEAPTTTEPAVTTTEPATEETEEPTTAPVEEEKEPTNDIEAFEQEQDEEGKITLIALKDSEKTSYAIPEGVVALADDLFKGHKTVEKITLPSTLTSIGKNAFDGCVALESIAFPTTLTTVGECAFLNCAKLTAPALTNTVVIGDLAFYGTK